MKSYCYVSSFKWMGGNCGYKTIQEAPGAFLILDDCGQLVAINRHPHNHAVKAVGYLQAPDGNMKAELA